MSDGTNNKSRSVLVTGATGFIGQKLVQALERRSDDVIYVLARDMSRVVSLWNRRSVAGRQGDLEAITSLEHVCDGVDTVFHLAGFAHSVNVSTRQENEIHKRITVTGTEALLEAALRAGVRRFVFVSSVKAMGEGGEGLIDENSESVPTTTYGVAKRAAEEAVLASGARGDMEAVVLRLPLVYGAGNKGNIPRMIEAIDRGRFPPLPEVGNRRSMVHVDDVVQALLLAADKPEANGQVYLVTDEVAYSTREIYRAICSALGKRPWPPIIPAALLRTIAHAGELLGRWSGLHIPFNRQVLEKLLGSAWYSSAKIRRELGFHPQWTLTMALPEMIQAYRNQSQGAQGSTTSGAKPGRTSGI